MDAEKENTYNVMYRLKADIKDNSGKVAKRITGCRDEKVKG